MSVSKLLRKVRESIAVADSLLLDKLVSRILLSREQEEARAVEKAPLSPHTRVVPSVRLRTHLHTQTMTSSSSSALLPEETHVRVGENALVASLTFALFWATFGLAWLASNKYVPEFRAFPAPQKADWCSRCDLSCGPLCFVCACVCSNWLCACVRLFYEQSELDDPRRGRRRGRGHRAHVHHVGQRLFAHELHPVRELHLLCRCVHQFARLFHLCGYVKRSLGGLEWCLCSHAVWCFANVAAQPSDTSSAT